MWNSHWLLKGHMVIWRMRMRDACEVAFQQERRNWKGDFRERRLNIFSLAGCKSRSCDSGVNNGVTNTLWQIEMNILG